MSPQKKNGISALAAGCVSAGLFLLTAASGLGFFFLFLPALPLFWVGLGGHPRLALHGALAASFLILFLDVSAGIVFLLLLGLPAWTISRFAMLYHDDPGGRVWFPVGLIMLRLALYASGLIAAMALFYTTEPGGLAQAVAGQIREALGQLDGEYAEAVALLTGSWSFLIFSLAVWLWALLLYAYAWLANMLLKYRRKHIRPDFAVAVFPMPHWMLSLLALCALASLAGSPPLAFVGKAILIALMLPYFLLGAALLHQASRDWPSRGFFLFFIYLFVFAQFWPALFFSGAGLIYHIKHLSAPKNSSKN